MRSAREYLTENGELIVPPEYANWLQNYAKINGDVRLRYKISDAAKHAFLEALNFSARLSGFAASGTKLVGTQGNATDLLMTTTMAAHETGRSKRCVRHWCHSGRLKATKRGRDWEIHPVELKAFLDRM